MFCTKCGTEVPETLSACPNCGKPVATQAAPTTTVTSPTAELNTHLVGAIISTICCCLPFGVVSIIYAAMATCSKNAGDLVLAKRNADRAGTWMKWAIISGVVIQIINLAANVIAAIASKSAQ